MKQFKGIAQFGLGLLFLFAVSTQVSAQCNITATATADTICIGQSVTLGSSGWCPQYLMNNDFNNGTIGQGWTSTNQAMFNNPCGSYGVDGTTYLWMGSTSPAPRFATSVAFDVTLGGNVCFDMRYAIDSGNTSGYQAPCEGPDLSGEGVNLQYSTNYGQTWVTINYWNPYPGNNPQYINWNNYCEPIPAAAQTTHTMFRWAQTSSSGNDYDHWGLDNVQIGVTLPTTVQWSHGPTVFNPPAVTPSTTTTYYVTITDGISSAVDSVTVVVLPDPVASINGDINVCLGDIANVSFNGTTAAGSSYQWNFNGATVLSGSGSGPYQLEWSTPGTYTVSLTVDQHGCATASTTHTVNVLPNATANAGNDTDVCLGSQTTLTASGGGTYAWSTGETSASITVSPQQQTTYTVTVTNSSGCTGMDDVVVDVLPQPQVNAGYDTEICEGSVATLTATGGTTMIWSTGETNASITVSPTQNTQYTVTVSDGSCTATDQVWVNVLPIPDVDAGVDQHICPGETVTLVAQGANEYVWSNGSTEEQITVSPVSTTTYTVTVEEEGCTATDDVVVIVNQPPPAFAGNDEYICPGESAVLHATGGIDYKWNTGHNTANITVTPSVTTTYIVTVYDYHGCSATDEVVILLHPEAQASAGGNQEICIGSTATLTASGGIHYEWSTGETTQTINVSPNTTTAYSVTVTDSNGCQDVDVAGIGIVSLPNANAGSDISICQGSNASITATGGSSYEWSSGETTATINVSPSVTTTYIVTVSQNACTATDDIVVNILNNPTVSLGPDVDICLNDTLQINAVATPAGVNLLYLWSTGETSQNISVHPQQTTTYTLTVTDNTGCSAMDDIVVTVNPLPNFTLGQDRHICDGSCDTLAVYPNFPNGGYLWNTGQTTQHIIVCPSQTTSFHAVVTNQYGCRAMETVTVYVAPTPTATLPGDIDICEGEQSTISVNNASPYSSFSWSNGQTGSSIVVSPTTTTTYTMTVTLGNCTATDDIVVNVHPQPVVNLGQDETICYGQSISLSSLSSSTGGTYQWSNGSSTPNITVSPTHTTTYTLTVTEGICSASDDIIVNVTPFPLANAGNDVNICSGSSTTLTASGGTSYLWSTGETTVSITVNPAATTTYTLTVTENNCSATDDVVVTLTANPSINLGPDQDICEGETLTLVPQGASYSAQYTWSNGQTTPQITVTPTQTTSYSVTVSEGNCSATDEIIITVNPQPVVDLGPNQDICEGEQLGLQVPAVNNQQYIWSNGATGNSITVNPTQTSTYSITVHEGSCSATDEVIIIVHPTPTADAGQDTNICLGTVLTLNATGGGQYEWSNGSTTSSINVSPAVTTTYTVTVSSVYGCSATDDVVVSVDSCGCEYQIQDVSVMCTGNQTCIMLEAITPVSPGIIGMDYCLEYDTSVMTPTGTATLGNVVLGSSLVQGVDANYYINTSVPGRVQLSIYYTSSVPPNTFFTGQGDVICVDFYLLPSTQNSSSLLTCCELEESYALYELSKCAYDGHLNITQDYYLEGNVIYWNDILKPLKYDSLNPSSYNATMVFGADSVCGQNSNIPDNYTDMNGEFVYNYLNGPSIIIKRDIAGDYLNPGACLDSTSILDVINGADCYYAGLITTFNTFDAITSQYFLPNAFQMVAGDVNMNDKVRANDITLIQDRILANICEFPQAWNYTVDPLGNYIPGASYEPSMDWRFVDSTIIADHLDFLPDPAYPVISASASSIGYWRDNVPDVPECIPVRTTVINNCTLIPPTSYHGILLGDLDGSWLPDPAPILLKSNSEVILNMDQMIPMGNNIFRIPLTYQHSGTLVSFDMSMLYDENAADVVQVIHSTEAANANFNMGWNDIQNNQLRMTSYSLNGIQTNNPMYYIDVEAKFGYLAPQHMGMVKAYLNGERVDVRIEMMTTNFDEISSSEAVNMYIYPNPNKGQFTIDMSGFNGEYSLELVNILGEAVWSKEGLSNPVQNIDISEQAEGIYFVRCKYNGKSMVKKVVYY